MVGNSKSEWILSHGCPRTGGKRGDTVTAPRCLGFKSTNPYPSPTSHAFVVQIFVVGSKVLYPGRQRDQFESRVVVLRAEKDDPNLRINKLEILHAKTRAKIGEELG